MQMVDVLGLPFGVADYGCAADAIIDMAKAPRPTAVAACATHPVTEARLHKEFFDVLKGFNLLLPDGMPLVWLMKTRGVSLLDRVYGPHLMRCVIERTPKPYRHFLFGGSPECLIQLEMQLKRVQPELQLVGSLSPPYRKWSEGDEDGFAKTITQANPDFIWVALGGGKQERWISQNRHRYGRGVFLAVGDAFELLAGRRRFAPNWMQRAGLGWCYRLVQEPRRLWKRYLFYNTIFIGFSIVQIVTDLLERIHIDRVA